MLFVWFDCFIVTEWYHSTWWWHRSFNSSLSEFGSSDGKYGLVINYWDLKTFLSSHDEANYEVFRCFVSNSAYKMQTEMLELSNDLTCTAESCEKFFCMLHESFQFDTAIIVQSLELCIQLPIPTFCSGFMKHKPKSSGNNFQASFSF